MFTNNKIKDVHETRYIASWLKVGGELNTYQDIDNFRNWLLSLGLTEDEAYHVSNLATCGRIELEASARIFIKNLNR